jgi:hypothetical protein
MDNGVINIVIVVLISVCVMIYILWKNSRRMEEDIKQTSQQRNLVRHDERALALCRAIRILNPNVTAGVDYVIRQDSPEQEPYIAEWMADTSRPTEEAISSAVLEITDARHEDKFAAMRRADYPSVEEQLDAAYQARQGNNAKQLEVDDKIRRVKEQYPKGDECF